MIRALVVLAVVLYASVANAARCGDDARAWIARCAEKSGVPMQLASCPASVAIVASGDLRIEVNTSANAFKRAGGYGLSPVGSFADWSAEPEPHRRALDALATCIEQEAPTSLLGTEDDPRHDGRTVVRRPPEPWLLFAALAAVFVTCGRRARDVLYALLAIVAVFVLRRLALPFAFFHQNGQGPYWIELARNGDAGAYGPGYPEIFGWIAHGARPDRAVAVLQELIAATLPLSAFVTARNLRASRALAVVLAFVLAFDLVLLRTARSESYFAVITSLLFAAAAVLAASDRRRRFFGLVAAALLVAQAARVHPLAWVPSAMVPLVLLCRPGLLRDRVVRVLVAALVIGLVATPLVLEPLRVALASDLGHGFLPGARARVFSRRFAVAVLLLGVVVISAMPRTRKVGTRAAALVIVCACAWATDVLVLDAPVVRAAELHMFAPVAVGACAALLAFVPQRTAIGIVAAIAALHVFAERKLLVLPTDARELDWALRWREQLGGGEVAALTRVERRMLVLPMSGNGLPIVAPIDEHGSATFGATPRWYYRSSLCSTPEGAPLCDRFESAHRLRLIESRRFPSIASLPWEPLPPGEIEVSLYAVE